MLLTHALALSASQFVHKKKSQRIYTSMHSAGLELTKLTYTRLEDNLIRHRGDRFKYVRHRGTLYQLQQHRPPLGEETDMATAMFFLFLFPSCWSCGNELPRGENKKKRRKITDRIHLCSIPLDRSPQPRTGLRGGVTLFFGAFFFAVCFGAGHSRAELRVLRQMCNALDFFFFRGFLDLGA